MSSLAAVRLMSFAPFLVPKLMPQLPKLAGGDKLIDKSHRIMVTKRFIKFYETEYCFPIARIQEALAIYNSMVEDFAKRPDGRRYFANFPGEVRFIRGDKGTLLSPTIGEESAF